MFQSIRFRLMLLAAVPLGFALIVMGNSIKTAYSNLGEVSDLERLVQLASHVSAHVHESQKERGATGVFMGSGGKKFQTELAEQRRTTDTKRAALKKFLETFDASSYGKQFEQGLSTAVTKMELINNYRTKASNLSIPAKEALGFYTDHNTAMLDLVANASNMSDNAALAKATGAYENFLQGKERAGIERAIMCKTFSADQFESGTLRKFSSLITAQDIYFNEFNKRATDEQRAFFESKLSGAAVNEVQRMRDVASEKGDTKTDGFGVDADHWFDMMTQKINRMKEVEDQLSVDLTAMVTSQRASARWTLGLIALFAATVTLAVLILVWAISRSFVRALNQSVAYAEQIAQGDLTNQLKSNRKDEIGKLLDALNTMGGNLREMLQSLGDNAATLANSSTELSDTSAQLTSGAEETTHQSTSVASAAEEMSTNMTNMASSTEQMTVSVKTVATSVEEMTASIGEIAANAEQASTVAASASQLAEQSNNSIKDLGNAADEIGQVIETIQDIAEQTNLLALNATIEAARAGDAGKGFAVVATEVKELAKQTAEATEDIRQRIEGIQGSTGKAVDSVRQISDVIGQVNHVSKTIASAVEEQSITTKEIARNISQTSDAAQTVAVGVAESASATQEITENITHVDSNARQTAQNAQRTQVSGQQLNKLAAQLRMTLGRFTLDKSQLNSTTIELPTSVPQQIRDSFHRVEKKRVFDKFYDRFVNSDSRIAPYFSNTDFSQQKELLKGGIALALRYATGESAARQKVGELGTSHSRERMNIPPELYPLWLKAWIETVAELDDRWTAELETLWREQLQRTIDAMKSKYEQHAMA